MTKNSAVFVVLSFLAFTTVRPMMDQPRGFFIPASFHIETAFDKLTVNNICQTLTFAAGLALLYKAGTFFATSFTPEDVHPIPAGTDLPTIKRGRRKASLSCLLAGCAFTTAGLLQKYGSKLLEQLPRLKQRFFR